VGLSLYGICGDMLEALLPVAILCVVSLLGTAVWLPELICGLEAAAPHDPGPAQRHPLAETARPVTGADEIPPESRVRQRRRSRGVPEADRYRRDYLTCLCPHVIMHRRRSETDTAMPLVSEPCTPGIAYASLAPV
jgi:hypothetical protein